MKINNIFLFLIFLFTLLLIMGCGQQTTQKTPQSTQKVQEAPIDKTPKATEEGKTSSGCDVFPDKLDACEQFSCEFKHPFTGEMMKRNIAGIVGGKCHYTEQMPNNGLMDCKYPESLRKAVAQYFRDSIAAESAGTEIKIDTGSGKTQAKYTIDGKEVENPAQESLDTGVCVVSGYN